MLNASSLPSMVLSLGICSSRCTPRSRQSNFQHACDRQTEVEIVQVDKRERKSKSKKGKRGKRKKRKTTKKTKKHEKHSKNNEKHEKKGMMREGALTTDTPHSGATSHRRRERAHSMEIVLSRGRPAWGETIFRTPPRITPS